MLWKSELTHYPWGKAAFLYSHFTSLYWKSTTRTHWLHFMKSAWYVMLAWDFVKQDCLLDFSNVDIILISNYHFMLALPFITEVSFDLFVLFSVHSWKLNWGINVLQIVHLWWKISVTLTGVLVIPFRCGELSFSITFNGCFFKFS